jgi:putative transposase
VSSAPPTLSGTGRRLEIFRGVCAERDASIFEPETHAAITCRYWSPLGPRDGIHRLVEQITGRSSRLLRQEFPTLWSRRPTLWTNSYVVATVGRATWWEVVKRSVEDQKNV